MTDRIDSIRRPDSRLAVAQADRAKLEEWAVELYDKAGVCRTRADDIQDREMLGCLPEGRKYWLDQQRRLRHEALMMEFGAEALLILAGRTSEDALAARLKDAEAANRELYRALQRLGLRWGGDYEPMPNTEAHGEWLGRQAATREMQRYLSRQASPAAAAE